MMNWNFLKLGTVKYETNNYELVESFKNICVNTDTAEVVFLPAQDGVCRVICYEPAKANHTVECTERGDAELIEHILELIKDNE